ncbi:MAG: two-component sensor histidine kinase, partial [Mesorhizobium sp.]
DLARRLDESIKETYSVVALTDREDLIAAVDNNADLNPDKDQLFSLTGPDGNHQAGNFTASGLPDGFSM